MFLSISHGLLIIDHIGVNISERKSGTDRTKKRKKQELVIFHHQGSQVVGLLYRLDAKRILPELR